MEYIMKKILTCIIDDMKDDNKIKWNEWQYTWEKWHAI